jgi:hypothetical protein
LPIARPVPQTPPRSRSSSTPIPHRRTRPAWCRREGGQRTAWCETARDGATTGGSSIRVFHVGARPSFRATRRPGPGALALKLAQAKRRTNPAREACPPRLHERRRADAARPPAANTHDGALAPDDVPSAGRDGHSGAPRERPCVSALDAGGGDSAADPALNERDCRQNRREDRRRHQVGPFPTASPTRSPHQLSDAEHPRGQRAVRPGVATPCPKRRELPKPRHSSRSHHRAPRHAQVRDRHNRRRQANASTPRTRGSPRHR